MPGAINKPTIRITPASCKPSTIVTTIRVDKQRVDQPDAETVGAGEFGIEGDQLELFPEDDQRQKRGNPDRADQHDIAFDDGGCLPEDEVIEARLAGIGIRLNIRQQRDAGGEPTREHNAQRRVPLDARGRQQRRNETQAKPTGDASADEQRAQLAPRQQKSDRHTRQRRVRQRVPDQALLPQHGKTAERAAEDAQNRAAQSDNPHRIGKAQAKQLLAKRNKAKAREYDGGDDQPDAPVVTAQRRPRPHGALAAKSCPPCKLVTRPP